MKINLDRIYYIQEGWYSDSRHIAEALELLLSLRYGQKSDWRRCHGLTWKQWHELSKIKTGREEAFDRTVVVVRADTRKELEIPLIKVRLEGNLNPLLVYGCIRPKVYTSIIRYINALPGSLEHTVYVEWPTTQNTLREVTNAQEYSSQISRPTTRLQILMRTDNPESDGICANLCPVLYTNLIRVNKAIVSEIGTLGTFFDWAHDLDQQRALSQDVLAKKWGYLLTYLDCLPESIREQVTTQSRDPNEVLKLEIIFRVKSYVDSITSSKSEIP